MVYKWGWYYLLGWKGCLMHMCICVCTTNQVSPQGKSGKLQTWQEGAREWGTEVLDWPPRCAHFPSSLTHRGPLYNIALSWMGIRKVPSLHGQVWQTLKGNYVKKRYIVHSNDDVMMIKNQKSYVMKTKNTFLSFSALCQCPSYIKMSFT